MQENNIKFLNENLFKFRKEKGLSQEELGNLIGGISRQSVSRWELGEIIPDTDNIIALCKVLDKEISDLVIGMDYLKIKDTEETPKRKFDKKKVLEVSKYIVILIICLLVINIIYRFIILTNINNKAMLHMNENNYKYVVSNYDVKNEEISNYEKEEVVYKDGIYDLKTFSSEKLISHVAIDFTKNIGYQENGITHERSDIDFDNQVFINGEKSVYLLRETTTDCPGFGTKLLNAVIPIINIKSSKESYIIKYTQNSSEKQNVEVVIDKQIGLPIRKVQYKSDKIHITEYNYEFNKIQDIEF